MICYFMLIVDLGPLLSISFYAHPESQARAAVLASVGPVGAFEFRRCACSG